MVASASARLQHIGDGAIGAADLGLAIIDPQPDARMAEPADADLAIAGDAAAFDRDALVGGDPRGRLRRVAGLLGVAHRAPHGISWVAPTIRRAARMGQSGWAGVDGPEWIGQSAGAAPLPRRSFRPADAPSARSPAAPRHPPRCSAGWWKGWHGPAIPGSPADPPRRPADAWRRNAAAHAASHVPAARPAGDRCALPPALPPHRAGRRGRRGTAAPPARRRGAAPGTPPSPGALPAAPARGAASIPCRAPGAPPRCPAVA